MPSLSASRLAPLIPASASPLIPFDCRQDIFEPDIQLMSPDSVDPTIQAANGTLAILQQDELLFSFLGTKGAGGWAGVGGRAWRRQEGGRGRADGAGAQGRHSLAAQQPVVACGRGVRARHHYCNPAPIAHRFMQAPSTPATLTTWGPSRAWCLTTCAAP